MRCFECNEVLDVIKIDTEIYSSCPDGHYKVISYQNGEQLETMYAGSVEDGYTDTTYFIKVLNYTKMQKSRHNIITKIYNGVVVMGTPINTYVLFKTDYLIPAGSCILDLPEFNGETFSEVLNKLDSDP